MEMKEDNEGFVKFPKRGAGIMKIDAGKTIVYLAAFDSEDARGGRYCLSNIKMEMPGTFVSDDVTRRPAILEASDIDALLEMHQKEDEYDSMYFPGISGSSLLSIPLTSAICIGWSRFSYELSSDIGRWNAGFEDLTSEGKRLYYSMRKLHNNKELRILTFNCV